MFGYENTYKITDESALYIAFINEKVLNESTTRRDITPLKQRG